MSETAQRHCTSPPLIRIARFLNWKLRNEYDDEDNLVLPRPRGSEQDEERFAAWREGRTGFP